MTRRHTSTLCGLSYELGRLCDIEELEDTLDRTIRIQELRAKGLKTYSRLETPILEALSRCVHTTLVSTAIAPMEIDAVFVATETFSGLLDQESVSDETEVRAARNQVFDCLEGIGIEKASVFCTTFGGSSNFLQSVFIAKPLVETGSFHTVLLICIDRVSNGITRFMDAAISLTGDGVACCVLTSKSLPVDDRCVIDYVGIAPYGSPATRVEMKERILDMYRATKSAAAECYESLGLSPADFSHLVVSNYNELTCNIFTRLLGFSPDRAFSRNVARTGHIPTCDLVINLKDLLATAPVVGASRILVYANGPISCGVIAVSCSASHVPHNRHE